MGSRLRGDDSEMFRKVERRLLHHIGVSLCLGIGDTMQKSTDKKKTKCKNCEGKGLIKNGDKKVEMPALRRHRL